MGLRVRLLSLLALSSPVVTVCTTCFNVVELRLYLVVVSLAPCTSVRTPSPPKKSKGLKFLNEEFVARLLNLRK
jgi:hypothetical protein